MSKEKFTHMNNFGARLKEERKRLRLTQTEFAALAGLQLGAQVNYEKNERSPDANYLMAIAGAGADVTYILTGRRSDAAAAETSASGRGLEGYPEVGAEEVLNAVDQLGKLMVATDTVIPPKKLGIAVRLAAKALADDARKRQAGEPVEETNRLRELLILSS